MRRCRVAGKETKIVNKRARGDKASLNLNESPVSDLSNALSFISLVWVVGDILPIEKIRKVARTLMLIRFNVRNIIRFKFVLDEMTYECTIKTGLLEGASADVSASLTIYGKDGDSGPRHLKHLPREDKVRMEAGGDGDLFHVKAINLGQLTKVVISLNRQSWNVKWFLDSIEVEILANERVLVHSSISKCSLSNQSFCLNYLANIRKIIRNLHKTEKF